MYLLSPFSLSLSIQRPSQHLSIIIHTTFLPIVLLSLTSRITKSPGYILLQLFINHTRILTRLGQHTERPLSTHHNSLAKIPRRESIHLFRGTQCRLTIVSLCGTLHVPDQCPSLPAKEFLLPCTVGTPKGSVHDGTAFLQMLRESHGLGGRWCAADSFGNIDCSALGICDGKVPEFLGNDCCGWDRFGYGGNHAPRGQCECCCGCME